MTTATRLLDILSLIASDHRIQVFFTYDTDNRAVLEPGVEALLDSLQMPTVTWKQATSTRFGLVIAASENDRLHELAAPILLVPHGLGYQKFYPGGDVISGLNPARLMHEGRVIPTAILLSHPRQQQQLEERCPAAAPRAVIAGDPSLDRMLASRHRETYFREAFGAQDKTLVVLASTWGPDSLLGAWPDLPNQLLYELPVDEYRVAAILHPGIWSAHGPWQVRSWLSRAETDGLHIVPPTVGWQAALVAASAVIADHGSLGMYAAALDKPLLLSPVGSALTVPGSATAALMARTARLQTHASLRSQIDAIRERHAPGSHSPVVDLAVAAPGRCAPQLRPLVYGLLGLAEPPEEPAFPPVPLPAPAQATAPALVVGADVATDEEEVALIRYPDRGSGPSHAHLDHRHLVVEIAHASIGQVMAAAILAVPHETGSAVRRAATAADLLRRWPHASIVAAVLDPRTCEIHTRTGTATLTMSDAPVFVDPLLLASLAYVRITTARRLPSSDRLRVGGSVTAVEVAASPTS